MVKEKRLQVFVSSTYADLRSERQAAVEAILSAGHIPAGMELFAAGSESQMTVIRQWIDESDVFLLILGGRYGSLEPQTGKSYTHLEYEYALEKEKPLFAVVIEEDYLKERVKMFGMEVFETDNPQKLKEFRSMVLSRLVKFWRDPRDIKLAVHETMADFARRADLTGWIPGNQAVDAAALAAEIARLTKENNQLRDRLENSAGAFREQLNETIDALIKLTAEYNGMFLVPPDQRDPLYLQRLGTITQTAAALTRRGVFLARQHPDQVTDVEYASIAQGLVILGDLGLADEFWRRAIEVAPSEFYRIAQTRAYADFLFNQGKFAEGRSYYEAALSIVPDTTDFNRYTNGYTHQMRMFNEGSNRFFDEAEREFEKAQALFQSIENPRTRDNGISGLWQIRNSLPPRPALYDPNTILSI